METRMCLIYVVINCFVIQYSESKSFSLNDAIVAETQQKHDTDTRSLATFTDTAGERFSLNKALSSPIKTRKLKKTEGFLPRSKIISPLKYRKTFQIKSPLKPKKFKYSPRSRHIRKSQSYKREINENDVFNQKYIPLLRSVGMLFDNILGPDERDSYEENKQYKYKRVRYYSGESDGEQCPCALTSGFNINDKSREKTNSITTPPATEIPTSTEIFSEIEVTTTATNNTANSDVSSFRHHTDLSVLFPRNTPSGRRDDNGFSTGSSATHNRSIERHIARDNGNSEYISGSRENKSYTESNEANTDSDSRDRASSSGAGRRLREFGRPNRETTEVIGFKVDESKNDTDKKSGDAIEYQRQDQFKMDRNKTKSSEFISEPVRRLRGATPKTEIETISDLSTSVSEEGFFNVTLNSTSVKRVPNRGSSLATENKEIHSRHETLIPIQELDISKNPKAKTPVVVIIDGYSVMRNRNGEKKLARKSIHINPK